MISFIYVSFNPKRGNGALSNSLYLLRQKEKAEVVFFWMRIS